jgi:hypothetical protein
MKHLTKLFRIVLILALSYAAPVYTFGQQQPLIDSTARLMPFAPGIVNTRNDEEVSTFSPDGKTIFFLMGSVYPTICFAKNINGNWTKPQVASFSGKWVDMDPFVSPDGKRIFFTSNRPLTGAPQDIANKHYEIWCVDADDNGTWGEAHHLGDSVNTGSENNVAPSVSKDGTLYWCSWDRQAGKGMQSYYSTREGDHYSAAKLLSVNGVTQIQDPFIAPNGKYLVYVSGNDLLVTFSTPAGWSAAQKFGAPVITGDDVGSPYVSHDGKTLYFTSGRLTGFYKRDPLHHALNFDELEKENDILYNGSGNIFYVPVNLPDGN